MNISGTANMARINKTAPNWNAKREGCNRKATCKFLWEMIYTQLLERNVLSVGYLIFLPQYQNQIRYNQISKEANMSETEILQNVSELAVKDDDFRGDSIRHFQDLHFSSAQINR